MPEADLVVCGQAHGDWHLDAPGRPAAAAGGDVADEPEQPADHSAGAAVQV